MVMIVIKTTKTTNAELSPARYTEVTTWSIWEVYNMSKDFVVPNLFIQYIFGMITTVLGPLLCLMQSLKIEPRTICMRGKVFYHCTNILFLPFNTYLI